MICRDGSVLSVLAWNSLTIEIMANDADLLGRDKLGLNFKRHRLLERSFLHRGSSQFSQLVSHKIELRSKVFRIESPKPSKDYHRQGGIFPSGAGILKRSNSYLRIAKEQA
jgi:hypothetical protein